MSNLEKILEGVLSEMGGAAMAADRIKKDYVQPTVDKYFKQVLNKIPHNSFQILGSAGKKPDSGDIDLALDTELSIQEVSEKLDNLNVLYKVGKGFDQIWTKFDQYDEEGNIVRDPNGRALTVQIDLMFGNSDWLDFAYWSPAADETEFTAHHRSALLAAIIRYAEELEMEDGSIQTHVINWGSGLWTKKRVKYVATKGKHKGKEREKQIKSDAPVITTPSGVAEFLTKATGKEWKVSDLKQPFEDLWKKAASVFDSKTMLGIAEYARGAIEHRNTPDNPGAYKVPKVISDILNENVSIDTKILRKLSKKL